MFVSSSLDMAAKRPVPMDPVDESLWYPVNPPTAAAVNEPTTEGVNLGVMFTVSTSGDLHSICYYRVSDTMSSSGTVALWQVSGFTDVLLTQADYTGHSGTGWKVIPLPEVFRLSAAKAYLAHLWMPSSGTHVVEAATAGYFANSRYSTPWGFLYASLSNGQADPRGFIRRNGFINTGTFARPVDNFQGGNYWVDVIYNARPLPIPPDPPMILKWPIPAGWPDASTTGPDPETEYEEQDLDPVTSTADDEIIENRDMAAGLSIQHNNVTVRNCIIRSRVLNVIYIYPETTGTLIEDCIIDAYGRRNPGTNCIQIGGIDVTVQRCNMMRSDNGTVCFGHLFPTNLIFRDNFVHHLRSGPGTPHYDGMEFNGGNISVLIEHNTIMNENNDTSCVMLNNEGGVVDDILIQDNVLFGGGYTCYCDEAKDLPGQYPITNVRYLRNLMRVGAQGYFIINGVEQPVQEGNQFLTHGGVFDAPPPGGFTAGQSVPECFFGYARDTTASIIGDIVDEVTGGLTVGVGFQVSLDGQITGVNFRRPSFSSTLLVSIGVWRFLGDDLDGGVELLGAQDYTNVIKVGLQHFALTTPIEVEAGDNLVVGAFIPRGSDGKCWIFAANGAFWPDPVSSQWSRMTAFSNNPATQLPDFSAGNGLFHYGPVLTAPLTASGFDSDYAVDPIFAASWVLP